MKQKLKAPFPAFGGKARIADVVWDRIGDVGNAVEPFCNSAAWLLARPHAPRVETVNDLSPYIANFWRATKQDPDAVVEACDWPVSEIDMHSRHRWLVLSPAAVDFRERMKADPDYFDAKVAGWWVWGACMWIGGEWCRYTDGVNRRPGLSSEGEGVPSTPSPEEAGNLSQQVPLMSAPGRGMDAAAGRELSQKRPKLQGYASGCAPESSGTRPREGGRPQLADAYDIGRGVCGTPPENRPHIGSSHKQNVQGTGVIGGPSGTCAERRAWLLDWFHRLQDRLRNVRVCCGHWLRVCDSESVTTRLGTTGIFLDPPYPIHQKAGKGKKSRSSGLYQGDESEALSALRDEVLAYCLERGSLPGYRIAVCGYEGDGYEALEAVGWEAVAWKAQGGYGNRSETGRENRDRERIWFSPGCHRQKTLLDSLEATP